jgi:hypothetical protein
MARGESLSDSPCGLAAHCILYQADNGGEDRTGDATTDRLSNYLADVDIAGGALKDRQERGEERPAARAADRAGNSVTECAEVDVLEASTYGVTTDGTSDELDNQINNRSRHSLSPLPVVVCFGFSLRSYCHSGVGRTRHACGVLRLSRLPTQQRTQGQGRDADDPAIVSHDVPLSLMTQVTGSRRVLAT